MNALSELSGQQRFQLLMESTFDYAIFFTEIDGRIAEWSSSAQRLIGYTTEEALRFNGRVIFTEEDRGRGAPELEMDIAIKFGQANDDRWHVRKDGTRFFAVGRMVSLRDKTGQLVGFAKIIRDATQYRNLEDALRASDEQFRATFAQAPVGMALTNLSGTIQQVNRALSQLVGLEARELEGTPLAALTAPQDRAAAEAQLQQMFAERKDYVAIEKRLVRADGAQVWVHNSVAMLRDAESRPLCIIDLIQDISPLKRSEADLAEIVAERTVALREKTRQMETFCYTVAHDLRAPLRTMAGYAEFLREDFADRLPAEGLDYLHRIQAAAGRLDRLIADLLGYTRIEQVPMVREDVDLTSLVGRVIEQVKADHRPLQLNVRLESPLGHVQSDPVTIEHVFLNLLSNAAKFHRAGVPPEIRVWSEQRNDRLRVWVEDNGVGVDPGYQERIWEIFQRLDTARSVPGTGVGLAIVARAMERLGGSRGIESNYPAGSRFWIELPG